MLVHRKWSFDEWVTFLENEIQNTTQKTKDQAAQIPLKTGSKLRFSGRDSSSCSI